MLTDTRQLDQIYHAKVIKLNWLMCKLLGILFFKEIMRKFSLSIVFQKSLNLKNNSL